MSKEKSHSAADRAGGFVRTVTGDLSATSALGICDAHEHVAMHGEWLAANFPEFVLDDLEQTLVDLRAFRAARGGWIVDSMPTGAGRDAARLLDASQKSGLPIVCPTGVHQARYYPLDHPLMALSQEALSELFVREISHGVDDGAGPLKIRAGVIKVASDADRLTTAERERFIAAAEAQRQTGCPILTHTAGSREAYEQVAILVGHGATPAQIVLSHCDKNPDPKFHRELLSSGVCLEYDQHFRQQARGERCVAVELLRDLVGDFPHQLMIGMDMGRRTYWRGYGGKPGLAWMLTDLLPMLRRVGLTDRQIAQISIENPLGAFAFRAPQ